MFKQLIEIGIGINGREKGHNKVNQYGLAIPSSIILIKNYTRIYLLVMMEHCVFGRLITWEKLDTAQPTPIAAR